MKYTPQGLNYDERNAEFAELRKDVIQLTYPRTTTGSLHMPWSSPSLENTGHNLSDHWAGAKSFYFAVAKSRMLKSDLVYIDLVLCIIWAIHSMRTHAKIAKFLPPGDVIHYLTEVVGCTSWQNSSDLFHCVSPCSGIPPCSTVYIYVHWFIVIPLTTFVKFCAVVFDPSHRLKWVVSDIEGKPSVVDAHLLSM